MLTLKSLFIITIFFYLIGTCLSQVPNGNFNDWGTVDFGQYSFEQPEKWVCFNFMAAGLGNLPVTKTTDAFSSDYAAVVRNIIYEGDTVPGILVSSENSTIQGGSMIINERYTSFSGAYKYFPENQDTMQVTILFYKHDSIVGFANILEPETVSEYKTFDEPVIYVDGFYEVPDSAKIFISASIFQNIQGNSVLYIDDLKLNLNQQIIINELLTSNNSTYFDEDGDAEDWIEIYNAGQSPVFLNNYFISNDYNSIDMWEFPAVTINPDEYLTIFASGKDRFFPRLHTNFRLSVDGVPLILSDPTGNFLDIVPPVELSSDISYGRYPNAGPNFVFFSEPTPNKMNNTTPSNGFTDIVPDFSVKGGFYMNEQILSITCSHPNAAIYYTLDGSEPDENSILYTGPITITSREGDDNYFTDIPTTLPAQWQTPAEEVFKATTIRAKAIIPNKISTRTKSHTYFVDPSIFTRYQVPVISILTDQENLFDHEKGIYVKGVTYEEYQENPDNTVWFFKPANYHNRGIKWERPAHISFFENSNSALGFAKDVGIRIHGGATRSFRHKSLRIYSKVSYGSDYIEYPIFKNHKKYSTQRKLSRYKRFILRNSGNDYDRTMFRDGLIHTLIDHTRIENQKFQPSVVFINGEYWGIHNIRERQDQYYLNSHYNTDIDNITILHNKYEVNEGHPDDADVYTNMLEFIENNELGDEVNYEFIKTQIDVDNFIDYFVTQIYVNNTDWPHNNIKYWRKNNSEYSPYSPPGKDGRWRWLFYDTDFGFGLNGGYNAPNNDFLSFITDENVIGDPNREWSKFLIHSLLENESFKVDFINRVADHINTSFKTSRVLEVIDSLENLYSPLIEEHRLRWHANSIPDMWSNSIEIMRYFAINRPLNFYEHVINRWDLTGKSGVTLNVSDFEHGKIKISSIVIDDNTVGIDSNIYPWMGTYFNDVPIPVRAIPEPGYKFLMWEETGEVEELIFVTLSESIELTAVFESDPDYEGQTLFINEFMSLNNSVINNNSGEFDDWIEIYNSGSDTIDIAGYYLTSDKNNPHEYRFPGNCEKTKIPPGEFIILWADNDDDAGCLHLPFMLNPGDGYLALIDYNGLDIIDSISYGLQQTDISFGRYPDAADNWIYFEIPTPGESNIINYINDYNNDNNNVVIYPNPASSFINISEKADIEIYSSDLKLIISIKNTDYIDISSLRQGIYFIRINENTVKRFIKK